MKLRSLSLSARVTLDMHSLNNEGTEGNQQQTRMVTVFDAEGNKASVNAVSGDMFKHILVEYLTPLLVDAGELVSDTARLLNPDRLAPHLPDLCRAVRETGGLSEGELLWLDKVTGAVDSDDDGDDEQENEDEESDATKGGKKSKQEKAKVPSARLLDEVAKQCGVTDIAGCLLTRKKPPLSLGRKSVVEFGWVVGVPGSVATEQYFHVKYAPEGREKAAGDDTVAGKQAIFHRPASSGVYALVSNLELDRIGLNDITRKYKIGEKSRRERGRCLLRALMASLLAPKGAQRNTQNPHIVGAQGVIAVSSSTLPAPTVSPLNPDYAKEMEEIGRTLNGIRPDSVQVKRFANLAEGAQILAGYAAEYEPVGK